jgi:hypothetical protein
VTSYYPGFAVVLSGSKIPCVLSKFLVHMYFISSGISDLHDFGAIHL